MALLHGDYDSSASSFVMAGRSSTAVNDILSNFPIREHEVHRFTTPRSFGNVFLRTYELFEEHGKIVGYLAFLEVGAEDLEAIDKLQETRRMPRMRILHYEDLNLLIVKFMPGVGHEVVVGDFLRMFMSKLPQQLINDRALEYLGAGRFTGNGHRKEGDCAWRPRTRSVDDWPSVVLEVGVSEGISALRTDAHFWISQSGGRTRVAILVAISKASKTVKVERWGHVASTRPQRPVGIGHMQHHRPRMIEELEYDANHRVIRGNPPFTIPANLVFDVLPNGVVPDDFQFSHGDLMNFFDYIRERMPI